MTLHGSADKFTRLCHPGLLSLSLRPKLYIGKVTQPEEHSASALAVLTALTSLQLIGIAFLENTQPLHCLGLTELAVHDCMNWKELFLPGAFSTLTKLIVTESLSAE